MKISNKKIEFCISTYNGNWVFIYFFIHNFVIMFVILAFLKQV